MLNIKFTIRKQTPTKKETKSIFAKLELLLDLTECRVFKLTNFESNPVMNYVKSFVL